MIHSSEIEAVAREAWAKQAPQRPDARVTVVLPVTLGGRFDRAFRSEVRAWDFVRSVAVKSTGPGPFSNGGGCRWIYVYCHSWDEVTG